IYPNLIDFRVDISPRIRSSDMESIADIVPFPSLKKLKLRGMYPFADDVLFRGNITTLEYLEIPIGGSDVVMLNDYKVFESKHKVLRTVRIGDIGFSSAPEPETSKLLGNMLETVQSLYVNNKVLVDMLIST
ncbi:hypothetical protein LPJ71_010146, partial [Coemansia sp. S17]